MDVLNKYELIFYCFKMWPYLNKSDHTESVACVHATLTWCFIETSTINLIYIFPTWPNLILDSLHSSSTQLKTKKLFGDFFSQASQRNINNINLLKIEILCNNSECNNYSHSKGGWQRFYVVLSWTRRQLEWMKTVSYDIFL